MALCFHTALCAIDVKHPVHPPWWPPGSEASAESVGIVSRNRVYMTAMMAYNATAAASAAEDTQDVADIAAAAGTNMSGLVSCLVNTRRGATAHVRRLFENLLGEAGPALTVVEMMGEYDGAFGFTIGCVAVLPALMPTRVVATTTGSGRAIVDRGNISHFSVRAATANDALTEVATLAEAAVTDDVAGKDGGFGGAGAAGAAGAGATGNSVTNGLERLIECTAFVRAGTLGEADAKAVVKALDATRVPPALTVVHAPTDVPGEASSVFTTYAYDGGHSEAHGVAIACTALAGHAPEHRKRRVKVGSAGSAVVADGLVHASALLTHDVNASSAFDELATLLKSAGSSLDLAIRCRFFLQAPPPTGYPAALFASFQRTFCEAHPPPPTRAEYVAAVPASVIAPTTSTPIMVSHTLNPPSAVLMQCTAALPVDS